jgi:maltoporin
MMTRTTRSRGTAWAALVVVAGLLFAATWAAPASAEGEGPDLCKEYAWGCFSAGTYGRVHPSWNLRGGKGRPANLVSHGTRLELPPYAEVDLYYRKTFDDLPQDTEHPIQVGAVITLAFLEDLFHFTGDFDQSFALRNLYGWTSGLLGGRLSLWAGSRMYRGDDIYLFDFWPLDNLNTYGGGAELTLKPVRFALHVGTNRLDDDFQYQEIEVTTDTPVTTQVVYLDRQRTVVSLKATIEGHPGDGDVGIKGKIYGEFHGLPAGTLLDDDGQNVEPLPSDFGWLVGGQIGLWGWGRNSFANVFVRGAGGLAAYGEFGIPFGLDSEKKTTRAREFLVGMSMNAEIGAFGIMGGFYARNFRDADPNLYDLDDKWELIAAVRPHLFVGRFFQPFAEISYQRQIPNGLSPETFVREPSGIMKLSVGPSLAFQKGTYARPRFHVVYTASILDENARRLYPEQDPRRDQQVQHYLGLGVEWWINSSSY